jgi:hypothetical protein
MTIIMSLSSCRIARRILCGFDAQYETESSLPSRLPSVVDRSSVGSEKINDSGLDRFWERTGPGRAQEGVISSRRSLAVRNVLSGGAAKAA